MISARRSRPDLSSRNAACTKSSTFLNASSREQAVHRTNPGTGPADEAPQPLTCSREAVHPVGPLQGGVDPVDEPSLHAVHPQVVGLNRRDLQGGTAAADQAVQSDALTLPQMLQLGAPGPEGLRGQAGPHDLDHVVDEGRVVCDDEGPPRRVKGEQHVGLVVEPPAVQAHAGVLHGRGQHPAVHGEVKTELKGRIPEERHWFEPWPVQSLVAPIEDESGQQSEPVQGLRHPEGIGDGPILQGSGRRRRREVAVEYDDAPARSQGRLRARDQAGAVEEARLAEGGRRLAGAEPGPAVAATFPIDRVGGMPRCTQSPYKGRASYTRALHRAGSQGLAGIRPTPGAESRGSSGKHRCVPGETRREVRTARGGIAQPLSKSSN